jgi:hypothetical protein
MKPGAEWVNTKSAIAGQRLVRLFPQFIQARGAEHAFFKFQRLLVLISQSSR